jgi:hypothetical protein
MKKNEGRKSHDTVPFKMIYLRNFDYRNAGLSGIKTVRYRTEKTNDAGAVPVPE